MLNQAQQFHLILFILLIKINMSTNFSQQGKLEQFWL